MFFIDPTPELRISFRSQINAVTAVVMGTVSCRTSPHQTLESSVKRIHHIRVWTGQMLRNGGLLFVLLVAKRIIELCVRLDHVPLLDRPLKRF